MLLTSTLGKIQDNKYLTQKYVSVLGLVKYPIVIVDELKAVEGLLVGAEVLLKVLVRSAHGESATISNCFKCYETASMNFNL